MNTLAHPATVATIEQPPHCTLSFTVPGLMAGKGSCLICGQQKDIDEWSTTRCTGRPDPEAA